MDELFAKISEMTGAGFEQGMAYQRMLDAQDDFNEAQTRVGVLFAEIKASLTPENEGEPN